MSSSCKKAKPRMIADAVIAITSTQVVVTKTSTRIWCSFLNTTAGRSTGTVTERLTLALNPRRILLRPRLHLLLPIQHPHQPLRFSLPLPKLESLLVANAQNHTSLCLCSNDITRKTPLARLGVHIADSTQPLFRLGSRLRNGADLGGRDGEDREVCEARQEVEEGEEDGGAEGG